MGILEKAPDVRYLTYYLFFPTPPGTKTDYWVKQYQFIHDVQWELQSGHPIWKSIASDPKKTRDILMKGETHWKDQRKVEHRIKIEKSPQPERWGLEKSVADTIK